MPYTKRGRPRQKRDSVDFGTPELQQKRLRLETLEALDLCLERRLIDTDQHWCGLHLRWLHSVRFGTPCARTVDLLGLHYSNTQMECTEWRAERERDYADALAQLCVKRADTPTIQIAIYNEYPAFLGMKNAPSFTAAHHHSRQIVLLQAGLDILKEIWRVS